MVIATSTLQVMSLPSITQWLQDIPKRLQVKILIAEEHGQSLRQRYHY